MGKVLTQNIHYFHVNCKSKDAGPSIEAGGNCHFSLSVEKCFNLQYSLANFDPATLPLYQRLP